MTGVIIPSAHSSAAPKSASATSVIHRRWPDSPRFGWLRCSVTRARSARMPPSPWLSARITKPMYLTTTMSVSAQKTSERMPRTLPRLIATPWGRAKHSLIA